MRSGPRTSAADQPSSLTSFGRELAPRCSMISTPSRLRIAKTWADCSETDSARTRTPPRTSRYSGRHRPPEGRGRHAPGAWLLEIQCAAGEHLVRRHCAREDLLVAGELDDRLQRLAVLGDAIRQRIVADDAAALGDGL